MMQGMLTYQLGTDEAGRGPYAGPVVMATVCLPPHWPYTDRLRDSKEYHGKNGLKERHTLFQLLRDDDSVLKSIVVTTADTIDDINIRQAVLRGMGTSIVDVYTQVERLHGSEEYTGTPPVVDVVVDGNDYPSFPQHHRVPLTSVRVMKKADRLVKAVSAASILAKETRDAIMMELDQLYPQYNFKQHKGYGSEQHEAALREHGFIEHVHRQSFNPIKDFLRTGKWRQRVPRTKKKVQTKSEPVTVKRERDEEALCVDQVRKKVKQEKSCVDSRVSTKGVREIETVLSDERLPTRIEHITFASGLLSHVLYTDGACSNNQDRSRACAGSGVFVARDSPLNISAPLPGDRQTNNRAELYAGLLAIELGIKEFRVGIGLEIRTDSMLLMKGATKEWSPKANRDLFERIWNAMDEFEKSKGREVRFRKVKAHVTTGDGNEAADALARQAVIDVENDERTV